MTQQEEKAITAAEYEAHIPAKCRLRTAREHFDQLMWCWGLIHELKGGKKVSCDSTCEYSTDFNPEELRKCLEEGRNKAVEGEGVSL